MANVCNPEGSEEYSRAPFYCLDIPLTLQKSTEQHLGWY